ncbi:MAG: Spy/CpxP family protein refolding chaperone [Candidatus Binatia bacterium]
MYPWSMYRWKSAFPCGRWDERHSCNTFAPSADWYHMFTKGGHRGDSSRSTFGVRRPLRMLAYKLDLDPEQVSELARIVNELKTERAQGEVDERRTAAMLADAIAAVTFDVEKARAGAALRVKSRERLQEALVKALREIHALLDPQQRAKFADLIRLGIVAL